MAKVWKLRGRLPIMATHRIEWVDFYRLSRAGVKHLFYKPVLKTI